MSSKYSKNLIKKIRKEVLSGKTKYHVAKEMNICDKMVYYYTKDIPSKNPGRTEIRGRTLDTLKTLLTEGYVNSNTKNSGNLRTLQKHFKVIKRTQVNGKKSVYYLEDKNKKALRSTIKKKGSKIISYQDLASMSHVFDVDLSKKEKRSLIGRKQGKSTLKKHSSDNDSTGKSGGFLGRFLHSEVLPLPTYKVLPDASTFSARIRLANTENNIIYITDNAIFFIPKHPSTEIENILVVYNNLLDMIIIFIKDSAINHFK